MKFKINNLVHKDAIHILDAYISGTQPDQCYSLYIYDQELMMILTDFDGNEIVVDEKRRKVLTLIAKNEFEFYVQDQIEERGEFGFSWAVDNEYINSLELVKNENECHGHHTEERMIFNYAKIEIC